MRTNLHIHTTISDGRYTVEEVMRIMHSAGVEVMSITDHDRLDANAKAKEIAAHYGIQYINGIEISSSANRLIESGADDLSIHMLGYGFDLMLLETTYRNMEINKNDMANRLYNQLIRDGYDLSKEPNSKELNRTMIAKMLIRAKYALSLDEAFQTILDTKYKAFRVPKLGPETVIDMVHKAGGIVVWAHPCEIIRGVMKMEIDFQQIETILKQLVLIGLDGIEAGYARYDATTIQQLDSLAMRYQLCTTTGSDFHGKSEDEERLLQSPTLNREIQCKLL